MSEPKTAEPLMLSVNAIINGQFFPAGTPLPFTNESDLTTSLKPFIASDEAPPPEPVQCNIYDLPLSVRRQVRKLELAAAEKAWAQEAASEPLPEDLQAALEDAHVARIGAALKQAEYNQGLSDAAYKQAAEAAQPPQLYVRRGGAWGHVERAKLKPGETVFAKRPNGEMEAVGIVDATGGLRPQEIIP